MRAWNDTCMRASCLSLTGLQDRLKFFFGPTIIPYYYHFCIMIPFIFHLQFLRLSKIRMGFPLCLCLLWKTFSALWLNQTQKQEQEITKGHQTCILVLFLISCFCVWLRHKVKNSHALYRFVHFGAALYLFLFCFFCASQLFIKLCCHVQF